MLYVLETGCPWRHLPKDFPPKSTVLCFQLQGDDFTQAKEKEGCCLAVHVANLQQRRLEALNGIFKTARARARGYRNVQTFITMIYLIAAPLGQLFKST